MSRLILSNNDTIMDIWLNRPRGVKAEKGRSKADEAERA